MHACTQLPLQKHSIIITITHLTGLLLRPPRAAGAPQLTAVAAAVHPLQNAAAVPPRGAVQVVVLVVVM
jgi:hypothetical protein